MSAAATPHPQVVVPGLELQLVIFLIKWQTNLTTLINYHLSSTVNFDSYGYLWAAFLVTSELTLEVIGSLVFGSLVVVRASDLLNSRGFDPRPPRYWSVGTGLDDRLRAGIPPRYVTIYLCQLSLLPSVGRKWVPAKVRWCSEAGTKGIRG